MNKAISFNRIARYEGNVPRYTSYPTAVQFSDAVNSKDYTKWLQALSVEEPVSLYLHVPFCDELCRYCACNTLVMRREEAREAYGDLLIEELKRLTATLKTRRTVNFIHWGGGTPTTLPAKTMSKIMSFVRESFFVSENAEISIELDPRHFPIDYPDMLEACGTTRVSVGVQDLDDRVQKACGRIQSWEQTQSCIQAVRQVGIQSVNIDLIYGLPNQTLQSTRNTIQSVIRLQPDRLAVFGYAHVPWKFKRQTLLEGEKLPTMEERFEQRRIIDEELIKAGYDPIGLDHYALPHDEMSKAARNGTLHRNFQGYTVDKARVLLGVGASAISILPTGIVQNVTAPVDYKKAIERGGFPIIRGIARNDDDRMRWDIIERLMCDLSVDLKKIARKHNQTEILFDNILKNLRSFESDGLVKLSDYTIQVTEAGRPLLRNIAVLFDIYYHVAPQRHAQAI